MSKQLISPLLFFLSGGVALATVFVLFCLSERAKFATSPIVILLVGLVTGIAFFAVLYRRIFASKLASSVPNVYALPTEQLIEVIRDRLAKAVAALGIEHGWEEMRESRHASPDADGFCTMSFTCFYKDIPHQLLGSKKTYTLPQECVLQQELILQPVSSGTQVEIVFYQLRGPEGDRGSEIENKTRTYLAGELRKWRLSSQPKQLEEDDKLEKTSSNQ